MPEPDAPRYTRMRKDRPDHEPGVLARHQWNTGYRCLMPHCAYNTGFWPDDGSAEENILGHLSRVHPTPEIED